MPKKLNFLFISLENVGHVNACIGVAQVLLDAGHRVQFVVSEQWSGRLAKYGIEEVVIRQKSRPKGVDPSSHSSSIFLSSGVLSSMSPLERNKTLVVKAMPAFINEVKELDPLAEEVIKKIKPDVLLVDQVMLVPAVELSGLPWVNVCSFHPLMLIRDERTPPPSTGYPTNGDKEQWKIFREAMAAANENLSREFNDYVVSRGCPPLQKNMFARDSKFMNIYGYPLELDYLDIRPLPPNWHRFDNLKRTEHVDWDVPDQLKNKPGKLIYFSMGTIGSGNLEMMKRLIGYLSKSKHRFIVSKGPHHDKLDLPDHMWGQQSVPQIQVLPVVDLVITHGGNNTVCETFYFGKPMIVMPQFGDQLDNAQRLQETGLGLRLDPYNCTEKELLSAVDSLLNNKELNENLKNISKRIQTENSIAKLPKLIEQRLNEYNNLS